MNPEKQLELAEEHLNNMRDKEVARRRAQVPTPGEGLEFCEECENDIPDGRRRLGYRICVECAAHRERKR